MSNISFENFMSHEPLVRNTILSTKNEMLKNFDFDKLHSDDDIDKDYFVAVREECNKNIWFFFREIARVPSIYHGDGKQFEITPVSFSMILAYTQGVDFIASSLFPQSQMRETLILLALYEFACSSKSAIYKTINILVADEDDKDRLKDDICMYANLLAKALPEFITFSENRYRHFSILVSSDIDDLDNCNAMMTANSDIVISDRMKSIQKQNLYVFDYTHMSEKYQFKILECMYKYWHNNDDNGRLIIGADARDFKYGSPVTSFLQYMADEILETDDIYADPFANRELLSNASSYGGLMHIKESITDDGNRYKNHIIEEYMKTL